MPLSNYIWILLSPSGLLRTRKDTDVCGMSPARTLGDGEGLGHVAHKSRLKEHKSGAGCPEKTVDALSLQQLEVRCNGTLSHLTYERSELGDL